MMFSVLIATWLAAPLYLQIGSAISAVFIVAATAISFHYLYSRGSTYFKKWLSSDKRDVIQSSNPAVKKDVPLKKVHTIVLKPVCIEPILKKEKANPTIVDRVITLQEIVETYDLQDVDRVTTKKQRQFKIEKKTQPRLMPAGVLKLIKDNSINPIKVIQPTPLIKEEAIVRLDAVESSIDKNEADPVPVINIREAIIFEKFEKNEAPASPATDTTQEPTVNSFPLILSPSVFRSSPIINFGMYFLCNSLLGAAVKPRQVDVGGQQAGVGKRRVGAGKHEVGISNRQGSRDLLQQERKVPKTKTALVPFAPLPKPLIFQLQNRQPQPRMPSWSGSRSLASIARMTFRLFRR